MLSKWNHVKNVLIKSFELSSSLQNLFDIWRRIFQYYCLFIGNKAKGRISKGVFQENKARQIFRKKKFLTSWYAHVSGSKTVCFLENLPCFVFLKQPFWDFAYLPYYWRFSMSLTFYEQHEVCEFWCNSDFLY